MILTEEQRHHLFTVECYTKSAEEAFTAASLPLMQKISELEKEIAFVAEKNKQQGELNEKLEKENKDILETLKWALDRMINNDVDRYKCDKIIEKFNLEVKE